MASFKKYLAQLDKKLHEKNKVTEYLEKIEKATGAPRVYITLGVAGFWALYMIIGYGAELICNSIGFGYPAYKSLCALETSKKEDDTRWLTYWVTFAAFSLLEFFSVIILDFVPFYWLMKCLFLMYCFAPISNNGSDIIYNKILRPLFLRNQKHIDSALNKAGDAAKDLISEGVTKLASGKKE